AVSSDISRRGTYRSSHASQALRHGLWLQRAPCAGSVSLSPSSRFLPHFPTAATTRALGRGRQPNVSNGATCLDVTRNPALTWPEKCPTPSRGCCEFVY